MKNCSFLTFRLVVVDDARIKVRRACCSLRSMADDAGLISARLYSQRSRC